MSGKEQQVSRSSPVHLVVPSDTSSCSSPFHSSPDDSTGLVVGFSVGGAVPAHSSPPHSVGLLEGEADGDHEGDHDGDDEGLAVGFQLGFHVGFLVGLLDGCIMLQGDNKKR